MGGSPTSGNGQNGAPQGGMSSSVNGSTQAPTSASGETPTTSSSAGNATNSASSGSQPNATSAGAEPELSATLHPTGPNTAGEDSTVTLHFEDTQICSTLDLSGVPTPRRR
jgi:hypothetical protein